MGALEVLTVRPRRGRVVHATALTPHKLNETLCGKACPGWLLVDDLLTCRACLEVQRTKPTRAPSQDPSGHWRTKVVKLADRLGFERAEVWQHWLQLALAVEFESRIKRPIAEVQAFRLIEASLDKRGGQEMAS